MRTLYSCPLFSFFFLSILFPRLISAVADWMSSLPYFHTWCGFSANLEYMSEMCCMWHAENTGCKKRPKIRHLGTIKQLCRPVSSQLRHVSTIGKNLLNSNISSICLHNMANFGWLAAEIGSGVCGTPANFNGFCVLASLLQQRRSPEANRTLHDVWPSSGLVHYIYIFRGSCPLKEFCQVQNSHYVPKSCTDSITAQHSSIWHQPNFVRLYKEWNYGTFTEGATYIRLGGHHVGHQPTF